jgi:hypothetical protein
LCQQSLKDKPENLGWLYPDKSVVCLQFYPDKNVFSNDRSMLEVDFVSNRILDKCPVILFPFNPEMIKYFVFIPA